MIANYGLERERIAAKIDKRSLAQAIAVVVDTLVVGIETARSDYWINVELNLHIEDGVVPERHARINVYVPSHRPGGRLPSKEAPPIPTERVRVPVTLAEAAIARSMAWVVQTILGAVHTDYDDFWVNLDLNIHVKSGRAHERKARINVFGDLIDPYDTTIMDVMECNAIPQDVLESFCEVLGKKETESQ